MLLIVLFVGTSFWFTCLYLYNVYGFLNGVGIPYINPIWYFVNIIHVLFSKKTMVTLHRELYEKLEPHKIAGVLVLHKPSIMIRDPELIKTILVNDASYFSHRRLKIIKDVDPLSNNWFKMSRDDRMHLKAKFTDTITDKKIKAMFPLVIESMESVKLTLQKIILNRNGFDVVDLCERYTTDIMGRCIFGVETYSLDSADSEFRQLTRRIFKFRWQSALRGIFPNIPIACIELFQLQLLDRQASEYFVRIIKDVVTYRRKNNIIKGDFLDLIVAAINQKDSKNILSSHRDLKKINDQQENADSQKPTETTTDQPDIGSHQHLKQSQKQQDTDSQKDLKTTNDLWDTGSQKDMKTIDDKQDTDSQKDLKTKNDQQDTNLQKDLKTIKNQPGIDLKTIENQQHTDSQKDLKTISDQQDTNLQKDLKTMKNQQDVDRKTIENQQHTESQKDLKTINDQRDTDLQKDLKAVNDQPDIDSQKDLKTIKNQQDIDSQKNLNSIKAPDHPDLRKSLEQLRDQQNNTSSQSDLEKTENQQNIDLRPDSENMHNQQDDADLPEDMKNKGHQKNNTDSSKSAIPKLGKHIKNDLDMKFEMMTAQCLLFYVGGFDLSCKILSFLLFELARNPEIQSKAREDIISALHNTNGKLTYDVLRQLTYVKKVITETLRKYPPATMLFRKCIQSYKIPESEVTIKEGTTIVIPVHGLHNDKKYYEKPDQFFPKHFNKNARAQRPRYAYLPRSDGPRVRIAERFAKMHILVAAVHLIKNFSYELSPKTKLPVQCPSTFGNSTVKDGIWLKAKPATKTALLKKKNKKSKKKSK